jgi:negative regulator of flagellin synthesis FlgM
MQIYGPNQVHGPQNINAPHSHRTPQPKTAAAQGDQLDISHAAQIASQLSEIPDVRHDRVSAIRAAIVEGTYETDERLGVAVDRLLDEIG